MPQTKFKPKTSSIPFLHFLLPLAEEIARTLDGHGRADRPLLLHIPANEDFDPELVGTLTRQVFDMLALPGDLVITEAERHEGLIRALNEEPDGIVITNGEWLPHMFQLALLQYRIELPPFLLVAIHHDPKELQRTGRWLNLEPFFYKTFAWPRVATLKREDRRTIFRYGIARRAALLKRRAPIVPNDAMVYLLGRYGHEETDGARDLVELAARCFDAYAEHDLREGMTFDDAVRGSVQFDATRPSHPASRVLH